MKHFVFCAAVLCAVLGFGAGAGASPLRAEIHLTPLNDSGETATATLVQRDDGSLLVTVVTKNGGTDPQPVHIHKGGCADGGNVAYALTTAIDGKSETTLKDVKLSDLLASPNVINIHKSTKEMGTYTACALIKA